MALLEAARDLFQDQWKGIVAVAGVGAAVVLCDADIVSIVAFVGVWFTMDWLPEWLVLPARLAASVGFVHKYLLADAGLAASVLLGVAAHLVADCALDTLGDIMLQSGLDAVESERTRRESPGATTGGREPPPGYQRKYLYRLARASEPARDGGGREVRSSSAIGTVGWEAAEEARTPMINRTLDGAYRGVPGRDDKCLRMTTRGRVVETAAREFAGADDLLLLKFSHSWLEVSGVDIRYEAEGGADDQDDALIPHVYRGACARPELSYHALVGCYPIKRAADGTHIFPRALFRDEREEEWDLDPS